MGVSEWVNIEYNGVDHFCVIWLQPDDKACRAASDHMEVAGGGAS